MTRASTILIVDDEPSGRKTLEGLLYGQDYQLAFASSGIEAQAQATLLIPDLILLDVMMPGLDGFEVCRRLRADPQMAEVPIILVTALDDRDARLQGIEAGADDFISKPFDRVELRARVRTITRLNRYRRLLTERAKFTWVVEQADDGFLVISETDTVLYANLRARVYLELPQDEDMPINETFLTTAMRHYQCEPRDAWLGWPNPSAIAEVSARYLVRPEAATASAFWLHAHTLRLPAGAGAGWLVRLCDVTRQMTVRGEMWKFQAMIHHKLRTPMINILSVDMLAKHAEDFSSEQITEIARSAVRGAQRLRDEINDVLNYMTAPNLAANDAGFQLGQLHALVSNIGAQLEMKSIAVACETCLDGTMLALSHQAIELMLWELIENAKKFHPLHDPAIEILVFKSEAQSVCFQVRDDGMFLAPDQLVRAWTPYYQAEKYFTGQVDGMGLGLSMIASLIWSVGGTCRIANREVGLGVMVELIIPLAKPVEVMLVAANMR